ncbi:MAG: UbiX family flavin prenyltransferase [Halanaerobiaceae bacterium]
MRIITGITGASGAIYARRFVEVVNRLGYRQILIVSDTAREVIKHELGLNLPREPDGIIEGISEKWSISAPELLMAAGIKDFCAPVASGSRVAEAMVVIPCTMGTTSRLVHGTAGTLLERAFDVLLKENGKIILVPRETPLNQIHLRNLLELSKLGIDIIPAMPAFYHRPENIFELIDFIIGRVLEHLQVEHTLYRCWRRGDDGVSNNIDET